MGGGVKISLFEKREIIINLRTSKCRKKIEVEVGIFLDESSIFCNFSY